MMTQSKIAPLRPLILFFVLLSGLFIAGNATWVKKGWDPDVMIAGNLLLFGVSLASFLLTRRSLDSSNPNAFVRAMYGSFMIKLFVCAIAAFAYIMATKKAVNKPALFVCMGLYILYTALEVSALMKLLKTKKNA